MSALVPSTDGLLILVGREDESNIIESNPDTWSMVRKPPGSASKSSRGLRRRTIGPKRTGFGAGFSLFEKTMTAQRWRGKDTANLEVVPKNLLRRYPHKKFR